MAPSLLTRRWLEGILHAKRTDRRAAQLQAVGVAEIRDQRAHVGPGAAFDLVLRAFQSRTLRVRPTAALLEAVHGHDPLGHLQLLATPSTTVGALSADLHRRVGGRALAHLARRQRRGV